MFILFVSVSALKHGGGCFVWHWCKNSPHEGACKGKNTYVRVAFESGMYRARNFCANKTTAALGRPRGRKSGRDGNKLVRRGRNEEQGDGKVDQLIRPFIITVIVGASCFRARRKFISACERAHIVIIYMRAAIPRGMFYYFYQLRFRRCYCCAFFRTIHCFPSCLNTKQPNFSCPNTRNVLLLISTIN